MTLPAGARTSAFIVWPLKRLNIGGLATVVCAEAARRLAELSTRRGAAPLRP